MAQAGMSANDRKRAALGDIYLGRIDGEGIIVSIIMTRPEARSKP